MSDQAGALYDGLVIHRRFAPKVHALRYRMFMALIDIDALDRLDAERWLFSHNRFNLFAFYDRDHLPKDAAPGTTLRSIVEGRLAAAGLDGAGGTIRLLSLPRVLGYAFNPLSVYFCYRPDTSLQAILYEVNNTFGQRHTYVMPVEADDGRTIHQRCDKSFYVSPFLDMDMAYDFKIEPPGDRILVAVDGTQDDRRMISASFAGKHRPFTDSALASAFVRHPLVALMVVVGIHWEALKLWRKGIALRARPAPPLQSATFAARREVQG